MRIVIHLALIAVKILSLPGQLIDLVTIILAMTDCNEKQE